MGKKDDSATSKSGDLNTIVGKGTYVEGTLKIDNSIRIDGRIKGDVETNDSLIIGKDGEIEGNVKAKNAIIGGKIVGKLHVEGKVVLESKAIFHGEMKAERLVIDDGAVFDGQCTMEDEKKMKSGLKTDTLPLKEQSIEK